MERENSPQFPDVSIAAKLVNVLLILNQIEAVSPSVKIISEIMEIRSSIGVILDIISNESKSCLYVYSRENEGK